VLVPPIALARAPPNLDFEMTRWHTDRPIGAIAPIRGLQGPAAVNITRSDGPARVSLRKARNFYLEKLRKRRNAKEAQSHDPD